MTVTKTETNIQTLKINRLTQSLFDDATLENNELYIITDAVDAQSETMPTATASIVGKITQYVGATDSTYTNGHFYKCVSDGQSPATYSWEEVSLGGASYTAGNGIDITSGVISVASPTLTNTATGSNSLTINGSVNANSSSINIGYASNAGADSVNIGYGANCSGQRTVGIGRSAGNNYGQENVFIGYGTGHTSGSYSSTICIGAYSKVNANKSIVLGWNSTVSGVGAIQIGNGTNSTAGTMSVGLTTDGTNYNNYELLSADGTIPSARLTNAISSTTGSLVVADWSSNTQTINVTGVTATNTVWVSPAPASASDYANAGIICTAQGAGTLTFTCTTVPTNAITVNVAIN